MTTTILFAHPNDDSYGADVMLVHSANAAAKIGFSVAIAVPGGAPGLRPRVPSATMLATDAPVLRRKVQHAPLGMLRYLAGSAVAVVRLLRIIHELRPAVVLVNTVTIPTWVIAARLARRPVIVHVHELESDRSRCARSLLYAPLLLATHILLPSNAVRETVTTTYNTLADRVTVLHNPVDVSQNLPPAPPSYDDTLRILVAGRLSHRKGQHIAIQAIRCLRDRGIDARLSVVGDEFDIDSSYTKQLEEAITATGLQDRVKLLGHCNEMPTLYATHDAVVVPSTRPESFGLVALEGAAHARPVVASAIGGLCEVVEDGKTGYLIPPGNPIALADRLAALAKDSKAARLMGARGWRFVRQKFDLRQYQDRLATILQEMVKLHDSRMVDRP